MKLKNIGNKIISIGATVILPGEAKEVTGYDDNEIVKFFIGQGNLSEVKAAPPRRRNKSWKMPSEFSGWLPPSSTR